MIQANLLAETQPAADLANVPPPDEIHASAAAADLGPDAARSSKPVPQQGKAATLSAKEQGQQMSRKHKSQVAHPAGIGSERGLKPRKKDFLKRRKLKKKGLLHLLDEEPGEDLEAELLQDRHKPKFGEQAEAPLKVRLLCKTDIDPKDANVYSCPACKGVQSLLAAAASQSPQHRQGCLDSVYCGSLERPEQCRRRLWRGKRRQEQCLADRTRQWLHELLPMPDGL